MKILVYGAGVIGCLYAAKLKKAGNDVYLLARGNKFYQLRNIGIVLRNASCDETSNTHVKMVNHLYPEDHYDLIIVAVPKNNIGELLPVLAANEKSPNILFMLNNASGFSEYKNNLNMERVLFGFPGAGGVKRGNVVVYRKVSEKQQPTIIGEPNGEISQRLEVFGNTLREAGFCVEYSSNVDAWLKTHAFEITPMANALYLTGCDRERLCKTRDALVLMVRSIKEGYRIMMDLGLPIEPSKHKLFLYIPEMILLFIMRRVLKSKEMNELIGHADKARDEMRRLTEELRKLAKDSKVETTASDLLYAYTYPNFGMMSEGSNRLRMRNEALKFGGFLFLSIVLLIVLL